jgi:hypothetical protein
MPSHIIRNTPQNRAPTIRNPNNPKLRLGRIAPRRRSARGRILRSCTALDLVIATPAATVLAIAAGRAASGYRGVDVGIPFGSLGSAPGGGGKVEANLEGSETPFVAASGTTTALFAVLLAIG